jgi:ribonucleoside-diphosphate reductase alpha chain
MKPIFVVKSDGSREPLDITKVQTQISRACEGITNVSESMIELRASIQFEDGMTPRPSTSICCAR